MRTGRCTVNIRAIVVSNMVWTEDCLWIWSSLWLFMCCNANSCDCRAELQDPFRLSFSLTLSMSFSRLILSWITARLPVTLHLGVSASFRLYFSCCAWMWVYCYVCGERRGVAGQTDSLGLEGMRFSTGGGHPLEPSDVPLWSQIPKQTSRGTPLNHINMSK